MNKQVCYLMVAALVLAFLAAIPMQVFASVNDVGKVQMSQDDVVKSILADMYGDDGDDSKELTRSLDDYVYQNLDILIFDGPFNQLDLTADVYYYYDYPDGNQYVGAHLSGFAESLNPLDPLCSEMVKFAIGQEFQCIDSNMAVAVNPYYCWYYDGSPIPVLGYATTGSAAGPSPLFVSVWYIDYYFIAQRTDYSSSSTWVQIEAMIIDMTPASVRGDSWGSFSLY